MRLSARHPFGPCPGTGQKHLGRIEGIIAPSQTGAARKTYRLCFGLRSLAVGAAGGDAIFVYHPHSISL